MNHVLRIVLLVAIGVGVHATAQMLYLADAPRAATLTANPAPTTSLASTLERASSAVAIIDGYKELPVYATSYELANGQLLVTREELGAITVAVSSGSGFFVSADGYLLTNKHVVSDPESSYIVTTGKAEYPARIVYTDPNYDIAVLKVEGNDFSTLPLGNSESLLPGSPVIAFGNALGRFIDSASSGQVISLDQDIVISDQGENGSASGGELYDLIFTDAKVFPGDSGGPLLNKSGEVVGINVATAVGAWVGYAIPIERGKAALEAAGK